MHWYLASPNTVSLVHNKNCVRLWKLARKGIYVIIIYRDDSCTNKHPVFPLCGGSFHLMMIIKLIPFLPKIIIHTIELPSLMTTFSTSSHDILRFFYAWSHMSLRRDRQMKLIYIYIYTLQLRDKTSFLPKSHKKSRVPSNTCHYNRHRHRPAQSLLNCHKCT